MPTELLSGLITLFTSTVTGAVVILKVLLSALAIKLIASLLLELL